MQVERNGQTYALASTLVGGGIIGGLAEANEVAVRRGFDPADCEFIITPLVKPGPIGVSERTGIVYVRKHDGYLKGRAKYKAIVAVEFTYREPAAAACGWDG